MRVVVGLGSNLGDREETLRDAVTRLRAIAPVIGVSRVYATAPIGPPQPDYLNAAVLLRWEEPIRDLLAALLRIEADAGRVRRERWQARTLDLDILWTDGPPVADPDLTVPHARLHERAFAVLPLLDVAPDAPYSAAAFADQRIEATSIAL